MRDDAPSVFQIERRDFKSKSSGPDALLPGGLRGGSVLAFTVDTGKLPSPRTSEHEGGDVITAAATGNARQTKPRTTAALHELLQRIEGEYREMPGLNVTALQAQRLWGLDRTTCEFVLMTLVERGIVKRAANGTYARK